MIRCAVCDDVSSRLRSNLHDTRFITYLTQTITTFPLQIFPTLFLEITHYFIFIFLKFDPLTLN